MSRCKIPLKVGQYEAELLCDVTNVETFGVLLGQNWIKRMGVHYNRRRKTFIYPWMKKTPPQPEPSLQSVPEPETSMEPELLLDPVPEQIPEIEIEPEAVFVAEPVPKP